MNQQKRQTNHQNTRFIYQFYKHFAFYYFTYQDVSHFSENLLTIMLILTIVSLFSGPIIEIYIPYVDIRQPIILQIVIFVEIFNAFLITLVYTVYNSTIQQLFAHGIVKIKCLKFKFTEFMSFIHVNIAEKDLQSKLGDCVQAHNELITFDKNLIFEF